MPFVFLVHFRTGGTRANVSKLNDGEESNEMGERDLLDGDSLKEERRGFRTQVGGLHLSGAGVSCQGKVER